MDNDLYILLQQKQKELEISVKALRKSIESRAEKEMKYKMLLRTETLKLRDQGMPVGLIDKVVYGIPEVARARFERDVAEGLQSDNQESIQAIKLSMTMLDSQITREYGMGGV